MSILSILVFIGTMFPLFVVDTYAQVTFVKTYKGSKANAVHQTSDEGYIIIGEKSAYIYLIKTNLSGNVSWTRFIGGSYPNTGFFIEETSDGGYILSGVKGERDLAFELIGDAYIIKTDKKGAIVWEKSFGTNGFGDYGYEVRETPQGNFILAGVLNTGLNIGEPVAFLTLCNAHGDSIWMKQYHNLASAYNVLPTNDNGFIFTTFDYDLPSEGIHLAKSDSTGKLIWSNNAFSGSVRANALSITLDSNYVVAGQIFDKGSHSAGILVKVDPHGNEIWHKIYDRPEIDAINDVYPCRDGGFVLAGATEIRQKAGFFNWLIKTDFKGDTLWTKIYPNEYDNIATSVEQTNDGGYIVTGETSSTSFGQSYSSTRNEIFLMKTDSLGNAPWEDKKLDNLTQINDQHWLYPNPFKDEAVLVYQPIGDLYRDRDTFIMYDLQGREAKRIENIWKGQTLIERGDLSPGLYVYQLIHKEQVRFTGKVVVE